MQIVILTMTFSLPGCQSLKEKRQRMGGIHERYGRKPSVAVFESGARDSLDASEWSMVVVGTSWQQVESQCSEIEARLQRTVEGRVTDVVRQRL